MLSTLNSDKLAINSLIETNYVSVSYKEPKSIAFLPN